MLKNALIFLGGVAAGGGVCYIILSKKFEADKKKELSVMKDFYDKRLKQQKEKEEVPPENPSPKFEPDRKEFEKLILPYSSAYKTPFEPPIREEAEIKETEEVKKETDEGEDGPDDGPVEKRDKPFFITPDEFLNTCPFYDKIELSYYENDNVLVEDDEEVISPYDILGTDFTMGFSEFEKDACYVRNDKIACDYQINLLHTSYYNNSGYYDD